MDGSPIKPVHSNGSKPANPAETEAARKLHELLSTLWARSRSTILERLEMLRAAQEQLSRDSSDGEARKSGADAAHKLAGILGTFGLPLGTDVARQAELMLERGDDLHAGDLQTLTAWIDELGSMIEQKTLEAAPRNH